MAVALRTVSGVLMLTALCVAPLNFGSTRPGAFQLLIALVGTGAAAWVVAELFALELKLPPLPARIGVLLVGVSAAGWLFFLQQPDAPAFTRTHYERIVARWPFSVVPRERTTLLIWAACSIVALFALCDLARDTGWRRAIAVVVLVTGTIVAVVGLIQNATHARGIYWDSSQRMPGAFFATFFHHTAAGAYLNSVWPVGLGLVLDQLKQCGRSPRSRWLVIAALVATAVVLAAHSGHVSRFPQVIAITLLASFALWTRLWKRLGAIRGLRLALTMGAIGLALVVLSMGAGRLKTIASRWNLLEFDRLRGSPQAVVTPPPPPAEWPRLMRDDLFVPSDHRNYPLGDRGATYAAAGHAIEERPWFGWGPGGWMAAAAAHSVDPFVRTFFLTMQFTHNDLLQTAVEWGLIGAAGWCLVIPASVVLALRRLGADPSRDFLAAGAVTALVALFTQSSIDFPLQIPAVQWNAIALTALAWTVGIPAGDAIASRGPQGAVRTLGRAAT
jgi:O-antigen ligase